MLQPRPGCSVEVGQVALQGEIEATSTVAAIRCEGANCIVAIRD
jgi:hypothetical protein